MKQFFSRALIVMPFLFAGYFIYAKYESSVGKGADTLKFPSFTYHQIKDKGEMSGSTSLVDVNKDGYLDLLLPFTRSGSYFWFEFKSPDVWEQHLIGDSTETDVGGFACDIDGDGWIDAVTDKKWFRNIGGNRWEKYYYGDLEGSHDILCADMDNDGDPDIISGSNKGLYWYRHPDTVLRNKTWEKIPISLQSHHGGVTPNGIGDLNGDGYLDIVWGDRWMEGLDAKGESWREHLLNPGIPPSRFAGGLSARVWICDLNGDGRNDIVMTGSDLPDGPVMWFENTGEGQFTKHLIDEHLGQCFHSLGVADFDGNGTLDILSGGSSESSSPRKIYIWTNPDGRAERWTRHEVAAVEQCHELSIGDVDGDGDIDIAGKGWGKTPVFFLENKLK